MLGALARGKQAMQELPGYEFIRELGRGGMAVVYLATQRSLQRPVALKLLDRSVPGYGEMARRFINEAHTLAGLRHPNIVTVYDVVSSGNGDFISMEYLGHGSLAERLAAGLTLGQGLSILAQLASALDAAHAHGVVHRDIKPDNVLFRDDDTPVLTDFGIARRISADSQRVTQAGLAVGTPSYMSPEQIGGDEVDGRADQYSLGAMWYQMMTGKPPFEAEHTSDLLLAHLARPVPALPPALAPVQPVLDRMLAKKPEQRYPSLAAMLADLGRHLMGAPTLLAAAPGAPRVSPTERLRQLGFPSTGTQVALPASTQVLPSSRALPITTLPQGWRVPLAVGVVVALAAAVLFLLLRPGGPLSEPATPAVAAALPAPDPHSIAVLPFADLSQARDQAFMSDGLAEELINLLARVQGLRVIARTSSFAFRDQLADTPTIGRKLSVAHLLQGSVRREGDRLRVSAQLVRSADGVQLWSQTFDRGVDDVFAVQDEIAAAVVGQLKVKLMGASPHTTTTDPRAYALHLRARQAARRGDAEGLAESVGLYRQALAIDPRYAPAWVGLSSSYTNQANAGLLPTAEAIPLARAAIDRALATDANLARAHAQRAFIAMAHENDLPLAARELEQALLLEPDDIGALLNAARLAQALGRSEQAIMIDRYVADRDPINARAHYNLGLDLLYAGRPDEAIASWRTTLALTPGFIGTSYNMGLAHLLEGRHAEALASMQGEPSEIWRMIGLPMALHSLGRSAEADAALAALVARHAEDSAYNIAYVQAWRGNPDAAFEWLDRAIENHDTGLPDLIREPAFASLHQDRRWLPLLERLGKSPAQLAAVRFDPVLPD
jgi:TolB-like protein/tetratricopeptide (TPR) repeat protein